jgi:Na+-translocating ferredoxin:NAD+ oxidoreductase RNF subunit RnfB
MARSKKSFDRLLRQYKHKDLVFRLTKVPVLKTIGQMVIKPHETTLSYVPVYENLELPEGTVAPISVIEHFINEASDHLILSCCPCRKGNNCQKADPDFGCTFLGPAVRKVDPKVGRLVSREEALEHLREATEAGLVSCIGAFKFDAIMMGVQRDHKNLMTICHCCTCCCLSTSMPLASREARDLCVRMEGVNVEITDNCNGCGLCVETCIFDQITITDEKAAIGDECKGCGRCATVCRRDGVRITIDDPAYIDRCIERISTLVDVK